MAASTAEGNMRSWRKTQHPNGTDTELLTIHRVGKLFVLCGERFASKQIQAGDFSVKVVRCTRDTVSMVICKVGDHHWLLAKDSTVLRIGRRSFLFVLPEMLYGLILPAFGPLDYRYNMRYNMLEEVFQRFSAYIDITAIRGSDPTDSEPYFPLPQLESGIPQLDSGSNANAKIAVAAGIPQLDSSSNAKAKIAVAAGIPQLDSSSNANAKIAVAAGIPQLDSGSNANAKIAVAATSSSPPGTVATIGDAKIQKAMRMSAAVKLITRSLLNGSLRPDDHLHVSVAANVNRAYPTITILTNLFDAFELGAPPANIIAGRAPPVGFWCFKEEGLVSLFELVKYGGTSKRPRVDLVDANAATIDKEVEKGVYPTSKLE